MDRISLSRVWPLVAAVVLAAAPAAAQTPPLTLPDVSPRASVSERVGLTDIEIRYHRPGVNGRKIWGDLVPYGEPWRAGANENTTITFSTPVTVQGHALPAGTKGLHVLPAQNEWTVAFSKTASAWGSFSYDPKEDAARITLKPEPAEFEERLSYTFADPTEKSVSAVLRWEKVRAAIPIDVDTPAVVVASLRSELRGLPRFSWQGWNQAAAWCARNGVNLDEALEWSSRSVSMNENFQNLRVKALLLEKKGDAKTAENLRARAMKIATEADLNNYGYQLMGQKKMDEALEIFRRNVREHPASWNVYDSLAEALASHGDKKLAAENYAKALSMAPEDQKKRIQDAIARVKA
jgi:tetratricopeptide (TPR) repeat protein